MSFRQPPNSQPNYSTTKTTKNTESSNKIRQQKSENEQQQRQQKWTSDEENQSTFVQIHDIRSVNVESQTDLKIDRNENRIRTTALKVNEWKRRW